MNAGIHFKGKNKTEGAKTVKATPKKKQRLPRICPTNKRKQPKLAKALVKASTTNKEKTKEETKKKPKHKTRIKTQYNKGSKNKEIKKQKS